MILKSIRLICYCIISFSITAAILHIILIWKFDPVRLYAQERSEKLETLFADRGHYAIAAFGSSRIHLAFDPRIFDRELQTKGISNFKSYNLAVLGGGQAEQRAMALTYIDYLKNHGIKKSLIILELYAKLNLANAYLIHPRAIGLYNLDTVNFCMDFTATEAGLDERLERARYAAAAGVLHHMNIGMLASIIFEPSLNPEILSVQYSGDKRGFFAKDRMALDPEIAKMFATRPIERKSSTALMHPGYTSLIADLTSAAGEDIQLKFIYVVMPTITNSLKNYEDYPAVLNAHTGETPVLDYAKDTLLLESSLWYDPGHLNEKGAAVFSADLAGKVLKLNISPITHNAIR